MYNCVYKIRMRASCVHWKKYIPREGTDGGHRIQDVKSNKKKKKKMFVYKFDTTLFSSYILFHFAVYVYLALENLKPASASVYKRE